MKLVLLYCTPLLCLVSCVSESQNKHLTYQNIVILSDLSSRIDNKPPKDIEEIQKIIQYFKNECVKPGEKIGDKSSISFSAFSEKVTAKIDINDIKKLGEKQQFINSTGPYANAGLKLELEQFEEKVKEVYATKRNQGLDLISILIDKLEKEPIVKKDFFVTDGIDTTFIKFDNHIYIFTDGYLEYLGKGTNSQFYFGDSEIEKIRTYSKTNNVNISKALEDNPSLCLPPYKGKKNEFVTLHILETHERDKNDKLQTYRYRAEQRDNKILEAVWRKWATESGFKEITWDKY
jgi:hypothetical protein